MAPSHCSSLLRAASPRCQDREARRSHTVHALEEENFLLLGGGVGDGFVSRFLLDPPSSPPSTHHLSFPPLSPRAELGAVGSAFVGGAQPMTVPRGVESQTPTKGEVLVTDVWPVGSGASRALCFDAATCPEQHWHAVGAQSMFTDRLKTWTVCLLWLQLCGGGLG